MTKHSSLSPASLRFSWLQIGYVAKTFALGLCLVAAAAPQSLGNKVANFDGAGDRISVQSSPSLQNAEGFTLEFWVKPMFVANSPGANFVYKSDGQHGDSQRTYELKWVSSGSLIFAVYFELPVGSNNPHYAEITAPVPANMWAHVAAVYSKSGGMKLYVNGILRSASTEYDGKPFLGLPVRQTSFPILFGGTSLVPQAHLQGAMDEIRIWTMERSSEEIQRYFSCELAGTETGLVAYWNFENGTSDVSGNGHTATLLDNTAIVSLNGEDVIHAGCHGLSIRVASVEICWNSDTQKLYQVQFTSALTVGEWVSLGDAQPGDGLRQCYIDNVAEGEPKRFYRVVTISSP